MLRGADGAMTGFAYPEDDGPRWCALMEAGDEGRARDLLRRLPAADPATKASRGWGAIRKYTLAKRGAIAHPDRAPPRSGLVGSDDRRDRGAHRPARGRRLAALG